MMLDDDPTLDYYSQQDPTQSQTQPSGTPSWAPPGWVWNPDGTITLPNGGSLDTNAAPGPGGSINQTPQTSAPPEAPPGGGGGGGGGNTNSGQGLFNPALYTPFTGTAPTYQAPTLPDAPQFNAPAWKAPPAFSYQDFAAPTIDEAAKQPGYAFGVQQGEQALQQSRAAQGLLRTGGTLKDILDYGRNAATQNYGNVLQQDLGIYNTNRAGAVQTYNTNYQTQYVDPYQAQYGAAKDALAQANLGYQTNAANAQHVSDQQWNTDWSKFINSEDVWYNNQNAPFSKYLSLAQLGAANA